MLGSGIALRELVFGLVMTSLGTALASAMHIVPLRVNVCSVC